VDCPSCRAVNAPGHLFCSECGKPLPQACRNCGFLNPPGGKFCGGCGSALAAGAVSETAQAPAGGERRQVAVLFADLCGFTRLSSEYDAEEVHQLLGRFFEVVDGVVERYGGTIDKHIGDAVMAIFGAPMAHGNDPQRAVRAAIEIHELVDRVKESNGRAVQVHIGIASGEVVAGGTGSSRHSQYTVTGDAVNLASRLHDMAKPGTTLVSEAIHRAIEGQFESEAVGETTVAGLVRPVAVWRVGGLRKALSDRARVGLVGRRNELRQFAGIVEACRETGLGQTVYLRGEAGMGKSRLAEEFARIAASEGFATHKGLVLDFGVGQGQDAIRAVVHSLLGVGSAASPEERAAAAAAAIAGAIVEPDGQVFLHDLLNLPQPAELRAIYEAMDNAARNRGKQEVAVGLLTAAAARQPVLVTIEDIHWAGPITLQHLAGLSLAAARCPAILLLTSRIEGDPLDRAWRSVARNSALTTIDLPPLRLDEAAAMAASFIAVVHDVARQCVERAEGNPLFLEQLLRGAEDYASDAVPASIQSLVLARMDRLAQADRRALQAAAIVGQRFSLDALRALLDEPAYDPSPLIRAFLIQPEGVEYLFSHALIRDSVYGSLLKTTRRQLHQLAARWFESRDLGLEAEHLDRAEDARAPRAYLAAARAQAQVYHFEHAIELARRGLELAATPADLSELTLLNATLQLDLGQVPDAIAAYRQAVEAVTDQPALCRARVGLANALRISDQYDAALAELAAAEPLATTHRLIRERAEIHHLRGNLYFPLSNREGCLREHQLALSDAEQIGWGEGMARAQGGLGDAYYLQGRMKTAHDHFQRCVALCREHGFGRGEVAYRHMNGWTGLYLHGLPQAEAEGLAAAEMAKRISHQRAHLLGTMLVTQVRTERGDIPGARLSLAEGLELARRLGARNFEAHLDACAARLLAGEGRRGESLAMARTAFDICRQTGPGYLGPTALGILALLTDDGLERRKALADGAAILASGAVGHNYFWFYRYAIEASLADANWSAARAYAADLERYTQSEPLPWSDFVSAQGRALAAVGEGKVDAALTREIGRLWSMAATMEMGIALPALEQASRRI